MNETIRQLYERKSVRAFEEREIEEEKVQLILEAATQAPSAGNQQLYTILRITDKELLDTLSESCDHQPFIAKGKLVLIFCADCRKWFEAYKNAGADPRAPGEGDLLLAFEDAVIAAQNAVVAAHALGIGSCYIGDILENIEIHRKVLNLPEYVLPAAMLVFGYPTRQQAERTKPARSALSDIVFENTYPEWTEEQLKSLLAPKFPSGDFEEKIRAFCARKYDSDFAREMTRSVRKYLEQYEGE